MHEDSDPGWRARAVTVAGKTLVLLALLVTPTETGNVALGGTARLSGTTENDAQFAIDGNLSTVIDHCALGRAASGQRGLWEVDLKESFIITDITIYNADKDSRRLEDTAITIGSEATLASMNVCGNTGHTSDAIVNIQCDTPLVGRYVRLTRDAESYNQQSIQLCEVQINGYYSPYDRTFTGTIQVSDTTSSTMTLDIPPWLPNTDEDLEVYFYRVEYKQQGGDWIVAGDAPHTANEFIIFTINSLEANIFYEFRALPGVVLEGIQYIGLMGPSSSLFETPCTDGTWGINCDPCNCAAEEEICDVIEGSCSMSGCAVGYQGTSCNEECQNGMWGTNCAEMCNCEDVDEACDKTNGSCMISGCAAGYLGAGCKQECAEGTWGGGCTEICNCLDENEVCLTTDGSCPMSGCPAGYQDTACNQECSGGMWGVNCEEVCTCETGVLCDVRNGSCATTQGLGDSGVPVVMVAGVAGGILLVLIILILLFIICKKCCAGGKKEKQVENGTVVSESGGWFTSRTSEVPLQAAAVYENLPENPIPILELRTFVGELKQTKDGFKREYCRIPEGMVGTMQVANRPENRCKDRFIDIGAYDHSRVILKSSSSGSDYINANHIKGYTRPETGQKQSSDTSKKNKVVEEEDFYEVIGGTPERRVTEVKSDIPDLVPNTEPAGAEGRSSVSRPESTRESLYVSAAQLKLLVADDDTICDYIACQGPLVSTLEDFMEMIWQENINRVVMVTNLMEGGRLKCECYWPRDEEEEEDPLEIGRFRITLLQNDVYADYTIRELSISKDGASRKVHHFHFTGWPDHGLPAFTTSLLDFREKVRAFDPTATGPMLVHCSAGVGRSGTFIALDYLLDQAKYEAQVDVLKFVTQMRLSRMLMIQTLDQYVFVYDGILEASMSKRSNIPCGQLGSVFEQMQVPDKMTGKTPLQEQFELLDALRPHNTTMDTNHKRTSRMLGQEHWIEEVFVDGYRHQRGYLITPLPNERTVDHVWWMFMQNMVHSIVYLKQEPREDQEDMIYWPEEEGTDMKLGKMAISFSGSKTTESGTVRDFQITSQMMDNDYKVKQYEIDCSSSGDRKQQMKAMIEVFDLVNRWQQQTGNSPIVIQCRDGVELSGLFCAACYLLEKIQIDQEVDVFIAVKQVRAVKSAVIQNIEQYKFLYELALTYLENNSLYANFQ